MNRVATASFGAILALLVVLATRDLTPAAAQDGQGQAGDARLLITNGGTQGSINDLVYIVYQRPDPAVQAGLPAPLTEPNRTTLGVWRVQPDQELTLEGSRDITLDLLMSDYLRGRGNPLRVEELQRQLEDD